MRVRSSRRARQARFPDPGRSSLMRTSVLRLCIAALAILAVPSLADASPRLRFDSGQVASPLDPVPYFFVTASDGSSQQNACQSGHVGQVGCAGFIPNAHWDFTDPAHPVFVDDDPADARCFWFTAANSFGSGIPAASFHVNVSLLDPSGAVTPVGVDLPQSSFTNPEVDLGGSGPGAQTRSACTTPRLPAPTPVPLSGAYLGVVNAPAQAVQRETARPTRQPVRRTTRPVPTRRRGSGGSSSAAEKLCGVVPPNVQCGDGNGRQTSGGGEKVSHRGWPAVTGILWKVLDSSSRVKTGGPANDELLAHHGSDKLYGGAGKDILWGDWDPSNNNTHQRDILVGGTGADYIYPSHGKTTVKAGSGNDYIWAFYGKGTIDCGAGRDIVHIRQNGAFRLKGCETVKHFCSFGSDADGNCLKPGEKARRRG